MNGLSLSDLEAITLQKLRQPAGNYDRYAQTNIQAALNAGNREAARRLECIRGFAIIIVKSGYNQYAPPSDMIVPKSAHFYQNSNSYYELKFKTREWLDRNLPGWRRVTGGPPWYMFPGDNLGNLSKLGTYPIPNVDGNNYLIAPDAGVVVSGTGLTTTGNITGLNSGTSATVCTDSLSRNFATLGVTIGMVALNVTDGSKGQISAVNGAAFTVAALTGGTNNAWAPGDSFTVLAGEYGVVTSWNPDDEQYLFTSDVGGMTAISALTNNIYLEYVRQPLPLTQQGQYPETPQAIHEYLTDYAVWMLKRTSPRGSDDAEEAAAGLQSFNAVVPPRTFKSVYDSMDNSAVQFNW